MIHRHDMDYHPALMAAATTTATRHHWAETFYLPFAVPERRLFGSAYVLARPGLGVALSEVKVYEGLGRSRLDARYSDNQQQIPAPAAFARFSLASGLSCDLTEGPTRYQVQYTGVDDTAFTLDAHAIMPAYDIHDPAIDPKARTTTDEQAAHSGFGKAYGGHYDQLVHITGELRLRGERIPIDYVDCMDRSWGQRTEIGSPPMAWLHAIFGRDYAFHGIWSLDWTAGRDRQHGFAHGFVLDQGVVHGVTDAAITVDRLGVWGAHYALDATDVRGHRHSFQGAPIASGWWECYGCVGVPNVLNRWISADGRIGYGEIQEAVFYDSYLRARAAGLGPEMTISHGGTLR